MFMIKRGVWDKVFMSSHCIADANHMFENMRNIINWDKSQAVQKWHRQSLMNTLAIYQNLNDYEDHKVGGFTSLPMCITRLENSKMSFTKVCDALKGNGGSKSCLIDLVRVTKHPVSYHIPQHLYNTSKVRRTCGSTVVMSGECKSTRIFACECGKYTDNLLKQNLQDMVCTDAIQRVWQNMPSAVSHPKLVDALSPLIKFCKLNPSYVFLPAGDNQLSNMNMFNSFCH
jgi:hypothetical protein